MEYLLSILAGVIQGLTEFLPISSSGHLIIFHDIFNFNLPDDLLFDTILHLGTLVALVLFFYQDVEKIIRGFFSSLFNWNWKNNFNQRLSWLVIISTIPAAVVGYFLEDIIDNYLRSTFLVVIMLILVAILFWLAEKYAQKIKNIQQIGILDSIIIGCAQAIALIPGTSRSGITIIAGLGRGFKREEAARFSFILSIPIVFGAGLKKILDITSMADLNLLVLGLGFISSVVTGYLVIRFLIKYLTNHSLSIFAWYRLIIGVLMLLWLIAN